MLHVYNTLSRQKVPFVTVRPGVVHMYVCGMTVYDFCHLGHARMLVSFDVVQRWLRATGYQVRYVRNITDIDDKIIRRAVERGVPIRTLTEFFIRAMHADERALGVQAPDAQPRATEHVAGMLEIIRVLEARGLAYRAPDGDVNFAVRRFPGYGKLSGKSLDDLRAGERVAVSAGKQDPLDFVLWKSAKPDEPADTRWDSAYGPGRPGWHIECSAMSHSLLGMPLDIHGGGPDLKFPHHENEIAQSEGAFGGTLATTWMHCGPMMMDAEKMSKSLGNFRRIRDVVASEPPDDAQADYEANPREAEMLRFFLVRSHYRSLQNYTAENLVDAQHALDRLYQALVNVPPASVAIDWAQPQAAAFREAMDDDFNTAGAVAVLFDLASQANRESSPQASGLLRALGGILGLLQADPVAWLRSTTRFLPGGEQAGALTAQAIDALVAQRAQAKAARDFARADRIRDELKAGGVELADVPGGTTQWRRV